MVAKSALEATFELQLRAEGITGWEREMYFHPTRKWRFDFAWRKQMLAVEIDGGTWSGGRHVRGSGYQGDVDKFNQAVLLGWRVLHVTRQMVDDWSGIALVKRALEEAR